MSYELIADTHSYLVRRAGNEVLRYTFDGYDFHPGCHPVRSPAGDNLTFVRSGDHPWHEGMYFSWKFLNGHNVWDRDFYDPKWGLPVHVAIQPHEDQGEHTGLEHQIRWQTSEGEALVDETRRVHVGKVTEEDAYSIDWHIRATATAEEVEFERKPEWGGYAGMHTRLVRCVNPKIRNSIGEENIKEDNLSLAEWMDYNFWLDGKASRTHFEFWAGVCTMSHPGNFRHPAPFLGYYVKNIQSLHVPILRDEPMTLKQGESVELKYRHMIYDGKVSRERIEGWFETYSQQ